jgi:hypothetical protein
MAISQQLFTLVALAEPNLASPLQSNCVGELIYRQVSLERTISKMTL